MTHSRQIASELLSPDGRRVQAEIRYKSAKGCSELHRSQWNKDNLTMEHAGDQPLMRNPGITKQSWVSKVEEKQLLCGKKDGPPGRGKNIGKDIESEQVEPVQGALAAASWGQSNGSCGIASPTRATKETIKHRGKGFVVYNQEFTKIPLGNGKCTNVSEY